MKISDILSEARKNPEQNPKTSINAIIQKAYDETTDMVTPTTKNLFVSFTTVDKLGINPQSHYDTPLGIYSYPAEFIVDNIGDYTSMKEVPFAGDAPYANIFKANGNIIDVGEMYPEDARKYYKKIVDLWAKESGKPWKTAVDEVEQIINAAEVHAKFKDYPGGQFWYVTMRASEQLFGPKWKVKTPVAWNKLFRLLGIDGCLDRDVGIIHTSEPTQCVFFSIKAIKDVRREVNRYSPADVDSKKARGKAYAKTRNEYYKKFAAMTPEEIFQYFKHHDVSQIQYVKNREARMMILKRQADFIQYMTNTNEQEQTVALTANMRLLRYCFSHPYESAIIAGLKKDPDSGGIVLKYIPFPSEALSIALVQAYSHNIFDLKKITPAIIKAAADTGGINPSILKQFAANHGITI